MRRLLVTGGTGFIGQAVARVALDEGWTPVLLGVDSQSAPLSGRLSAVERMTVDLTDDHALHDAVERAGPDAIVHLAAFGAGGAGLLASADREARRAVAVNVGGFLSLLDAGAATGCRRLSWSSSTTVYGPAHSYSEEEVDEDVPCWPRTVYGITKLTAELLSQHAKPGDMGVVGLRLPLVYGPGRWYGGSQAGLLAFADDVVEGRPARLHASDQPLDWLYVDDAASALLQALDAVGRRGVYNVAGQRASLADMGRKVARHATTTAEVIPAAPDADPFPFIDGRRFARDTGFSPRYELAAGIDAWLEARPRTRNGGPG